MESIGGVPKLRMGVNKAGPVVTDSGNFIIDCDFGPIHDPRGLHSTLIHIPGVIETGIFSNMVEAVYFGMENGSVVVKRR